MHALLGLEVQSKVSGQAGKIRLPAPPARFAHNGLAGGSSPSSPTTQFTVCGEFLQVVDKGPQLAGFLYDHAVSETADLWLGGRFGAFVSGLKIPFPGNGDRCRQRLGSNGELLRRKSEHLVLAGPFGRQVGEADYSHAMGESSFDRSLDEVGREEGKRDRHVDLADAAAVSGRDAFRIRRRVRDELIEPATPAGDRCDQESAVLGTYCAGVLRRHGRGHENLTASSEWRLAPRYLQHIAASRPLGADSFCVGQLDQQLI